MTEWQEPPSSETLRKAGGRAGGFRRRDEAADPPEVVEPPEYSDDAVALVFSERHAEDLLYVAEWGRWLRWDGTRWAHDKTLGVFDLARVVCRERAAVALATSTSNQEINWSITKLASAQKVAAVERMARAAREHARASDQFDADPLLLNTPDGVVDLRDGTLRKHRRSDLLTKVTAVGPGEGCRRWRRFLVEITRGDRKAIRYLQRWVGYMLTGLVREHAFLFLHGPGGNGKSVFLNILRALLGDYATVADMDLFTITQGNQHPAGLADLRGARLVVAQEIEANRALAEAKVKALTGGDPIKARFMQQNWFEYQPVLKLVMAGNHRPVLRNPDPAMQRRLHLMPLTYKPETPDRELPELLRQELPGILSWAIQGCALWQEKGLGKPPVVAAATAAYFAEQDNVAQWLAERCEKKAGAETASAALYRDWKAWAEERGEQPGSNKAFSATLEHHYAKKKGMAGNVFLGVRLLPSATGAF